MNKTVKVMCVLMILLTIGFAGFGVLFILNSKLGMGLIGIGISFVAIGMTISLGNGVLFNKGENESVRKKPFVDHMGQKEVPGSVHRVQRVQRVQHVNRNNQELIRESTCKYEPVQKKEPEKKSGGLFKKKQKAEKPMALFDCNMQDITHEKSVARCNIAIYSSSMTFAIAGEADKMLIEIENILEYMQSSNMVKLQCKVDDEEVVYALTFNSALNAKAVYQTIEGMKGAK